MTRLGDWLSRSIPTRHTWEARQSDAGEIVVLPDRAEEILLRDFAKRHDPEVDLTSRNQVVLAALAFVESRAKARAHSEHRDDHNGATVCLRCGNRWHLGDWDACPVCYPPGPSAALAIACKDLLEGRMRPGLLVPLAQIRENIEGSSGWVRRTSPPSVVDLPEDHGEPRHFDVDNQFYNQFMALAGSSGTIECLTADGDLLRHGLRADRWAQVRVRVLHERRRRAPGTLRSEVIETRRVRRFYIHEPYAIEGGRGGARGFDLDRPVHPSTLDHPDFRAKNIITAAAIAEALTR